MMSGVFCGLALGAAIMATFVPDIRRAILALWVSGLALGAIDLTVGAELLAIVQWIISTLIAISFVFFALMFGEYGPGKVEPSTPEKPLLSYFLHISLGASFAAMVWLGGRSYSQVSEAGPVQGMGVAAIGKSLTQDHFISLEILALTLFLVLIGGGVIARPHGKKD